MPTVAAILPTNQSPDPLFPVRANRIATPMLLYKHNPKNRNVVAAMIQQHVETTSSIDIASLKLND